MYHRLSYVIPASEYPATPILAPKKKKKEGKIFQKALFLF